jgi:hypothetical protein
MRAIEDAVRASGLAWTILRPGGFASNAYAWVETVRAERMVAAPFGDVGIPVIDPADIAEVAAVALRKDEHAGQVYALTGPAAVTPRQQAEAIGAALGEPVRFVELTRAEAHARMSAFMPEPVVETTLAVLGEPNAAELRLSPDVEQVLGRAPRPFAEWARRNVDAFRYVVTRPPPAGPLSGGRRPSHATGGNRRALLGDRAFACPTAEGIACPTAEASAAAEAAGRCRGRSDVGQGPDRPSQEPESSFSIGVRNFGLTRASPSQSASSPAAAAIRFSVAAGTFSSRR